MRFEWASIITPTTFYIWHKNYTLDWKRPAGLDKIVFIELNIDYYCVIEDVPDKLLKCYQYNGSSIQFNLLNSVINPDEDYIAKHVSHVSCVSELKFCCWVVHSKRQSECSGVQSEHNAAMRRYVTKFKYTDAEYLARYIEYYDNTFIDCRQSENFLTTCLITNNMGKWILPGRDQETKDIIIRNKTICVIPFHTSAHCRTINKDNKDFTFLDVPLKLRNNVRQIEGTQENTFCYIDNEWAFNCYNPIVFKKPAKIPRELFDVYRLELERYTSNIDFAVGVIDFASWDDSYCIMYKSLEVSCRDFAHAPFSYKNHIQKIYDGGNSKKILNEYKAKLGVEIEDDKDRGVKFNIGDDDTYESNFPKSQRRSMRGKDPVDYDELSKYGKTYKYTSDDDDYSGKRKYPKNRDYESCEDILEKDRCQRKSPRINREIASSQESSDKESISSESSAKDEFSQLSNNTTRDSYKDSEVYKHFSKNANPDSKEINEDENYVKYPYYLDKLVLINLINISSSIDINEYSILIFDLKTNSIEDKIQYYIKPILTNKQSAKEIEDNYNFMDLKPYVTKEQIINCQNWEEIYTHANKWLDDKLKNVNWVFVTNGSNDLKILLPEQLNHLKNLTYHDYYKKYINIQDIFIEDVFFRSTDYLKKFNKLEMQQWWYKFNSDFTSIMLKYFEITPIEIKSRIDHNINLVQICRELNKVQINFNHYIKKITFEEKQQISMYNTRKHNKLF